MMKREPTDAAAQQPPQHPPPPHHLHFGTAYEEIDEAQLSLQALLRDMPWSLQSKLNKLNNVSTAEDLLKVGRGALQAATGMTKDEIASVLHLVSAPLAPTPRTALDWMLSPSSASSTDQAAAKGLHQRLSTGCPRLDEVLGGGFLTRQLTEIAGESGSGKTQLCLQACLQVQASLQEGGLAGAALYVATEPNQKLYTTRLLGLLEENPRWQRSQVVTHTAGTEEEEGDPLQHVIFYNCKSLAQLWRLLLTELASLIPARHVRLLVIDSIAALYREDFGTDQTAERARVLFSHAALLKQIADNFNMVVLVVNQVSAYFPSSSSTLGTTSFFDLSSASPSSSSKVVPALGLAWSNCINVRLLCSKTSRSVSSTSSCSSSSSSSFKRPRRAASKEADNNEEQNRRRSGGGPGVVKLRELRVVHAPHLPSSSSTFFTIEAPGVRAYLAA
ncbi:DNA repair protein xrcc3 [Balamuthia mandrillaris]